MKNLARTEAIRECKLIWKEIVESGLSKYDFLNTDAGKVWISKGYLMDCPLCDYTLQHYKGELNCPHCPLMEQHGKSCNELGHASNPVGFYRYVSELEEGQ